MQQAAAAPGCQAGAAIETERLPRPATRPWSNSIVSDHGL